MRDLRSAESVVQEIGLKIARATEESLLEQLNDFISRDLIEVQLTQPVLIREADTARITVRQSCRLVLKDKEYIERLEREVAELRAAAKGLVEQVSRFSDLLAKPAGTR